MSKGTEAQAEGKVEQEGHEGHREEHGDRGREEGKVWVGEACGMNRSRAGVFSTQGRSAPPGIGVDKSFDVSYIADLV